MRILGISCYFHDSAAALLEDGVLIAAAEEERFSRLKHDFGFPYQAIDFCLKKGNITGKDLDYVAFFEKPFLKFDRLLKTAVQGFPESYRMFVDSMRTWLFDKLWVRSLIAKTLKIDSDRILFSDHHMSHAASAYFCSPFDESAVITFDGVGEWTTTSMGVGKGHSLTLDQEILFPHSIGLLYSAFTAFLGFEVNEGEYKVMGMAPYGEPRYVEKMWKVVHQMDNGAFRMDPQYFSYHKGVRRPYTRKFLDLFGEPRQPESPFFTKTSGIPAYYETPRNFDELCKYNQYYAELAASIQVVTEELILSIVREAHRKTNLTKLCLAGGVALNSVANNRIIKETPFTELYIQPSAGDGGAALGAALVAWHCALGNTKRFVMDHAYWGDEHGPDETRAAMEAAGTKGRLVEDEDELIGLAVDRLLEGQVIGWSRGRFEWGPRALGNRSIIADPRRADTKDVVNAKIKFREPFRPFAPAVLAEEAGRFFELDNPSDQMIARFMLLVVPVLEDQQENIPAVSHLGTARIQTVHADSNPSFHQLIRRFGEATSVPVLLNTSFNVRGEPIVNTPQDALNTFWNSGLDSLILGNYLIEKP